MEILKPNLIFSCLIVFTGVLTSITDLKSQKIYNNHLIIAAVLGMATLIYAALWNHANALFHLYNGLIAFIISVCFYQLNQWRGGDTKLFTLYAFLMPAIDPQPTFFALAVNLFACAFITGAVILIPVFIKDVLLGYPKFLQEFNAKKRRDLMTNLKMTILSSWALFPVYYVARFVHLPIISMIITYLVFMLAHKVLRKKIQLNFWITIAVIMFGLLMRLWLNPQALACPALAYTILKITLFSVFSLAIFLVLAILNANDQRVPFAPLLFSGCILCYTPFLTWMINFSNLMRR